MTDRECAIHEAGHLIIGFHLGLLNQAIEFAVSANQWRAWYSSSSPKVKARRALAGILSHVRIAPETIPGPLLVALRRSVISAHDHRLERLALPSDTFYPLGASDDLMDAKNIAVGFLGTDSSKVVTQRLRGWEKQVRLMVDSFASQISALADDILAYRAAPNSGPLYTLDRPTALCILEFVPLKRGYKKQF